MRLEFKKGDILAVLAVVLAAVVLLAVFGRSLTGEKAQTLLVYHEGKLSKEVSLHWDEEFWVEGEYRNKIVIKDGRVSIAESDCPGADCVHSGWIQEVGRSIVCLPNRVELRIAGQAEGASDEVDFVIQ